MRETQLIVFANLEGEFYPAGRLSLMEADHQLIASSFTYGARYLTNLRGILHPKPLERKLKGLGGDG